MKSETTIMLSLAIALAIALVAGLVVVPVIEEAQAANPISDANNKGKRGESASGGKRSGSGGGGIST